VPKFGRQVAHYRDKQNIYKQGAPAYTLFYIQEGGVRLTNPTKHQPSAVTAILGAHDFLASFASRAFPFGVHGVALTASSIRTNQGKKRCSKYSQEEQDIKFPWCLSAVQRQKLPDHVGAFS